MNYKISIISGILLAATLFTACNNAKKPIIENLVYFSDASTSKSKDITLENGATTIANITVRLAKPLPTDVKVRLGVDEELLKTYNKRNEADLQLVKKENLTIPAETVIKAGAVSSTAVAIEIKSFETKGAQFAIPLTITSVEGNVKKSEVSSKIILNLVKPLSQSVPAFTSKNKMAALPLEDWNLQLMHSTLEWWCRVTLDGNSGGFTNKNQAVFDSGSSTTEMYIRFGDLIYAQGYTYLNNFLQVKTMGSQFDTGNPVKGFGLTGGVWIHFALTYDGTSGTSLLYKDGKQVATLNTGGGRPMIINHFDMISSGSYFRNVCEMCQVRLWKVTRTAGQIQKCMYTEVKYNDPDLELYLPMNEESGSLLKDVTGNGHNVTIGNKSGAANKDQVTRKKYNFKK